MARPTDQAWINTFSGRKFYPLAPHVDDIDIVDIAHALSMQCRFTGHVKEFYSVAQHSFEVCYGLPLGVSNEVMLWGLLHDAAEAYLIDLARPIKQQPSFAGYREAEAAIMTCVCEKFGLPLEVPEEVKRLDNLMLLTEARQFMTMHPDWLVDWPELTAREAYPLHPMSSAAAERAFLSMFYAIRKGMLAEAGVGHV